MCFDAAPSLAIAEAFGAALQSVGIAPGAPVPEAQLLRLRVLKNAQRELFHTRGTAAQRDQLAELLAGAAAAGAAGPGR